MVNDLKVNNTNILPLRWFANMCGSIACWSILKAAYLDEDENYGWQYKIHGIIHKLTWPISYKYGSFYEFSFDMSGDGWDDYDSDGVPYWEKYNLDWDYIDPETDDAFRVIKK